MHRFNDIPPYPPPMDYIAVLPLSACPVYHAIVIPSHVLNIITIMNTLKNISLYINAISPHRATTSNKRAVSPETALLFSFYFPGPPLPPNPDNKETVKNLEAKDDSLTEPVSSPFILEIWHVFYSFSAAFCSPSPLRQKRQPNTALSLSRPERNSSKKQQQLYSFFPTGKLRP